jgi:DNA-binding NtrC family response regulator
MVVDDNDDFRVLMQHLLEEEGWTVLPCRSVLCAFDILRDAHPDLVITDLRLESRRGGFELLHFMQLHPAMHDIPAILCTGAPGEIADGAEWLQQHHITVLEKPFDIDHLYSLVRKGLESAGPCARTVAG